MSTPNPANTARTDEPTPRRGGSAAHPGPPLAAPAIAFVVTFLASILIGPISGAGAVPSPFAAPATIERYFTDHHTITAISGSLMLLSAIPLLILSAITFSRLDFLAPNAPGPAIAGFGGLAASTMLMASALFGWTLSRDVVTDQPGLAHTVDYLMFLTGGPAHTAALGVMILGLAVTTLFIARTPRWLSVIGIGLAVLDVLCLVSLAVEEAAPLIAIGRFGSLAWLVAITWLIPRDRAARGSARR